MDLLPHVLQVIPGDGKTVYAYYNDGTVRLADIAPLIKQGTVFEPLMDDAFFQSRLTVLNGAVAWDMTGNFDETQCIDLDPIKMYMSSPIVSDPLENISA